MPSGESTLATQVMSVGEGKTRLQRVEDGCVCLATLKVAYQYSYKIRSVCVCVGGCSSVLDAVLENFWEINVFEDNENS